MTRIPDLFQTPLSYVSVCVFLKDAKAVGWFKANEAIGLDCEVSIGKHKHRLSLDVDPPDSDGDAHIHVNLAKRIHLLKDLPPAKNSLDEWNEALENFHGCSSDVCNSIGKYVVKQRDISPGGLVNGLGGISTSIGEVEFKLTGAEVSIKGGPFHRVTWSKAGDELRGEIFARGPVTIAPEYLAEAVSLLNDGVHRLILEAG